jgi:hypothetical protein
VFAIGDWEVGNQRIEDVVTALSDRIGQEKLLHPPTRCLEPA